MTSKSSGGYRPDYVVPPGETILEVIEEMGMTRGELAEHMGMPGEVVEGIIEGKVAITKETAGALERATGVSTAFWMLREGIYRERCGEKDEG